VTVLINGDTGATIGIVKYRNAKALSRFLTAQGHRWMRGVKVVVSDGSGSYRAAIHQHLGHARHVLDRFHVARWFAAGMIEVRRRIQRIGGHGSRPAFEPEVFRSRYLQLARYDHLNGDRIEALGDLGIGVEDRAPQIFPVLVRADAGQVGAQLPFLAGDLVAAAASKLDDRIFRCGEERPLLALGRLRRLGGLARDIDGDLETAQVLQVGDDRQGLRLAEADTAGQDIGHRAYGIATPGLAEAGDDVSRRHGQRLVEISHDVRRLTLVNRVGQAFLGHARDLLERRRPAADRIVAQGAGPFALVDPLAQGDELLHAHRAEVELFFLRWRRRPDLRDAEAGIAGEKGDDQQAEPDDGHEGLHARLSFQ